MSSSSVFLLKDVKKNSVRYDSDPLDTNPIASSIYISKGHLLYTGGKWPSKVSVSIDVVEPGVAS